MPRHPILGHPGYLIEGVIVGLYPPSSTTDKTSLGYGHMAVQSHAVHLMLSECSVIERFTDMTFL